MPLPSDTEHTIEALEGKVAVLEYYIAVLLKQASATNQNPKSIDRVLSGGVPNVDRTTLTGIFNKSVSDTRSAVKQHMQRTRL